MMPANAQQNLREAAAAVRRQPEVAGRLQVTRDEVDEWGRAADLMAVPYDTQRGVHMQSDGFTHHEEWDFAGTPPENYPLLLHYPYFDIYRRQVIKQADLVMALHLRGDAFTLDEKIADFAYYEARTVRDSSLSAAQQAVGVRSEEAQYRAVSEDMTRKVLGKFTQSSSAGQAVVRLNDILQDDRTK